MEGRVKEKLRISAAVSVAVASALVLAGCGGLSTSAKPSVAAASEDPALVKQALKEGALTIYTAQAQDVVTAVTTAFNEQYPGIKISTFRSTGVDLLNRYASEAEAGAVAADVLAPSTNPEFIEDHPDWFLKLTPKVVPNLASWPSQFAFPRHVAVAVTSSIITYNSTTVTGGDVPKTWKDLLDPQFKGKCILLDPRASDGYLSFFEVLKKKYGDSFLQKLAAQGCQWDDSGATASQEVASGSFSIAVGNYPAHNKDLIAQGAPVKMVQGLTPDPGLLQAAAISTKAPHPAAAKLFVNWFLTKQGQSVTCAGVYSPVAGKIAGCPALPKGYTPAIWGISDTERAAIYRLLGLS